MSILKEKNSKVTTKSVIDKQQLAVRNQISASYADILSASGIDLSNPELIKTPARAAGAFQYLTSGYHQNIEEVVNDALFEAKTKDIVLVKDIEFYSICEHHLLPIFGYCHVAYIPGEKMIGLSKVARIIDLYARRIQTQEKLTNQIADVFHEVVKAKGTCVSITAKHFCMMMRGVEKQCSAMVTMASRGKYQEDHQLRQEFYTLCRGKANLDNLANFE